MGAAWRGEAARARSRRRVCVGCGHVGVRCAGWTLVGRGREGSAGRRPRRVHHWGAVAAGRGYPPRAAVGYGCWLLACRCRWPRCVRANAWRLATGHSAYFLFAQPVLMPPPLLSPCSRPPPVSVELDGCFFAFHSMLLCCVLVTAFPAIDRPPRLPPSWSDRDRNEFVRDLRQIDVAGAAVTDTVPLEVLAAVDRGRNPEAVTKDTLYVRERVLGRFFPPRAGGGRGGEEGMGVWCRVSVTFVSGGGAASDAEEAQCARAGARGGRDGRARAVRMWGPACWSVAWKATAVWFFAPLWERGFEGGGAREVRVLGADADELLLRPPAPCSSWVAHSLHPVSPLPSPVFLCRDCSETLSEANDMARGKIAVMANFRYVYSPGRLGLSCVLLLFFLLAATERAEAGVVGRQRTRGGEWVLEGRLLTACGCPLPAAPLPPPAFPTGVHVPPLCCVGMRSPRPWRLTRRSRGRPDGCPPFVLGQAVPPVVLR